VRGTAAGVVAAAWLVSGCKDNPGFALLPDRPGQETSSGSTTVDEATTTTTTGTSGATTTTEDPPPVTEGSTSTTTEPPDTTDTTMGPQLCGNGVMDPGEQCDDGNDIPHDDCEANCHPLFAEPSTFTASEGCTVLAAADFNGDELIDLAVAGALKIDVFENDGGLEFLDQEHSFSHGGVPPNVMFARNLDGNKERPDIIVQQGNVYVCPNAEPFVGNYCENNQVLPFVSPEFGPAKLNIMQLADADGGGTIDAIVVDEASDRIGVWPGLENSDIFGDIIAYPMPNAVVGEVTAIAPAFIGGMPALDLVVAHDLANDGGSNVTVVLDFAAVNSATAPVMVGKTLTSLAVASLGLVDDLPEIVAAAPLDKRLFVLGGSTMTGYAVQGEGILSGPMPTKVLPAPLRGPGTWDLVSFDRLGPNLRIAPVDDSLPFNAEDYLLGEGLALVDIIVVDLDTDTDLDVVALDAACTVTVLQNLTKTK
jgi:cysteine-rich repeat protein